MRISAPSTQAAIVVVTLILMPMIGVVLLMLSPSWGAAWMLSAMTALVVFTARVFRGADETADARPWWRMTAAAFSSGLLSTVFLGQAAFAAFSSWSPPLVLPGTVAAVVLLVIAGAYANSAIRLARTGAERRATVPSASR